MVIEVIKSYGTFLFPLFCIAIWLAASAVLGLLSGWFRLAATYPDQPAEPMLRIRGQSGMMGMWVSMSGVLTLSVCPFGLRVGMMRVFGPFWRDFLVPWDDISATRKTIVLWPVAELVFGNPAVGRLSIPTAVVDRLARAAPGRWPEPGPFPEPVRGAVFRRLLAQWAAITCAAALFFSLVPWIAAPRGEHPPVLVAILLPAIFFGGLYVVKYIGQSRR